MAATVRDLRKWLNHVITSRTEGGSVRTIGPSNTRMWIPTSVASALPLFFPLTGLTPFVSVDNIKSETWNA